MSAKILIVDDDPELLRLIGFALHRAGYEPIAAQNADEAFKKVRTENPALIILDVMLPGVSGIDICRQLREQAPTLTLPIIMLSARTQVDDKIEGLEAGADEYLTKPINPKEMVARVASLLKRNEQLRAASGGGRRGSIIGILGAKGGVGTTTVALNLAIAMAMAQDETTPIAVELRSDFGTFAVQLGHVPPETLTGLLGTESPRIDERSVRTHLTPDASGIEVLYGPYKNERWLELDPHAVEDTLDTLSRLGADVIVDFPNYFGPAIEAAVRHCDRILLVTRPEEDSLTSGRKRLDLIRNWGVGRGVVDAIVVNHAPLALGLNVPQAEDQLGCQIIGVVPPAADACALVHKQGRPLLIAQPNNAAANKLNELAKRLTTEELV